MELVTVIVLAVTVVATAYLLAVAAAILDQATGRRWGLLALSAFFTIAAIALLRIWK